MKKLGWSRDYSIRKSKEFQFLKRNSRRFYTKHFEIWFFGEERDFPPVRLAVVVRKKIGKAVKRNRIRRIVKEFFRINQYSLPRGDYVVIVKAMPQLLSFSMIEEEFYNVFSKME